MAFDGVAASAVRGSHSEHFQRNHDPFRVRFKRYNAGRFVLEKIVVCRQLQLWALPRVSAAPALPVRKSRSWQPMPALLGSLHPHRTTPRHICLAGPPIATAAMGAARDSDPEPPSPLTRAP